MYMGALLEEQAKEVCPKDSKNLKKFLYGGFLTYHCANIGIIPLSDKWEVF